MQDLRINADFGRLRTKVVSRVPIMSASIPQQVLDTLQTLSPEEQKMVLDFVVKLQQKKVQDSPNESFQSFYDIAREFIGQGEGPSDLSTNLEYMKGYGQDSPPGNS